MARSRKRNTKIARPAMSSGMEALESRQMLSAAPWSWQDQQIGLDKETQNYPGINGKGQTIVIIDEGVDYNHPSLGGGYGNKIVASWNFDTNSYDTFPNDGNAHGTGTAGAIGADAHVVDGFLQQGVAPGAKIISLRASGTYNMKQALDWVIAHRTQYNIVALNYLDQSGADLSQTLPDLQALKNAGVFMAAAVGNYGPSPAYGFPDDVIHTVGSTNQSGQVSAFTPRGSALDLVAPGENVDVTWYYSGIHADLPSTGTSWTAPQVSGTAALIKQVNGKFSADQVYQIIRDSATMVYDSYSGVYIPELNVNGAIALAYQRSGQAHTAAVATATPVAAPKPTPAAAATPVAATPVKATTVTATKPATRVATPAVAGAEGSFLGTPFATNTLISAANYDTGGEGVGYHDASGWNEGGDAYRSGNVDTTWSKSQGTEVVGWTHAGEWMNYTLNVKSSGTYAFFARTASAAGGGEFHVEVDGKKVTGEISVANTGGWDAYTTQMVKGLKLKSGKHILRIVMDKESTAGVVGSFAGFAVAPTSASSWLMPKAKAAAAKKKK